MLIEESSSFLGSSLEEKDKFAISNQVKKYVRLKCLTIIFDQDLQTGTYRVDTVETQEGCMFAKVDLGNPNTREDFRKVLQIARGNFCQRMFGPRKITFVDVVHRKLYTTSTRVFEKLRSVNITEDRTIDFDKAILHSSNRTLVEDVLNTTLRRIQNSN